MHRQIWKYSVRKYRGSKREMDSQMFEFRFGIYVRNSQGTHRFVDNLMEFKVCDLLLTPTSNLLDVSFCHGQTSHAQECKVSIVVSFIQAFSYVFGDQVLPIIIHADTRKNQVQCNARIVHIIRIMSFFSWQVCKCAILLLLWTWISNSGMKHN